MNKLSCIIIDDEASAHKVLEHYCSENEMIESKGSFLNAYDAKLFLETCKVEILFLDINMPGMSGFDLLDDIEYKPAVILTTAHSQHAVKAFEYNVVDFLLKPIRKERFDDAVTKAQKMFEANLFEYFHDDYIEVKNRGEIIRINLESICYFQSIGNYVRIFTTKEKHLIHTTTNKIEQQLTGTNFIRIHKSFIVNKNYITDFKDHKIIIKEKEIPVGKTYIKYLNNYLGK